MARRLISSHRMDRRTWPGRWAAMGGRQSPGPKRSFRSMPSMHSELDTRKLIGARHAGPALRLTFGGRSRKARMDPYDAAQSGGVHERFPVGVARRGLCTSDNPTPRVGLPASSRRVSHERRPRPPRGGRPGPCSIRPSARAAARAGTAHVTAPIALACLSFGTYRSGPGSASRSR